MIAKVTEYGNILIICEDGAEEFVLKRFKPANTQITRAERRSKPGEQERCALILTVIEE